MDQSKLIATKKIPSLEIVMESSMATVSQGEHESTMSLYFNPGQAGSGYIEWDIPGLETTTTIGLWWDNDKNLIDYDGVFSLPGPAIEFLEEQGFKLSEEFKL